VERWNRYGFALPARYRGAYNTVQTVLNRLAEQGLVSRQRTGVAIEYEPALSEAEYLAHAISQMLAAASMGARRTAMARLIGDLGESDLDNLRRVATQAGGSRRRRWRSVGRRGLQPRP
jgi:predicted transcriptional regulator